MGHISVPVSRLPRFHFSSTSSVACRASLSDMHNTEKLGTQMGKLRLGDLCRQVTTKSRRGVALRAETEGLNLSYVWQDPRAAQQNQDMAT